MDTDSRLQRSLNSKHFSSYRVQNYISRSQLLLRSFCSRFEWNFWKKDDRRILLIKLVFFNFSDEKWKSSVFRHEFWTDFEYNSWGNSHQVLNHSSQYSQREEKEFRVAHCNCFWLYETMNSVRSFSIFQAVCVDEATANVDLETDKLVQDVLLVCFQIHIYCIFIYTNNLKNLRTVLHDFDWLIFRFFLQLIFRLTALTSAAKSNTKLLIQKLCSILLLLDAL